MITLHAAREHLQDRDRIDHRALGLNSGHDSFQILE
jgi:hypothetical protein